MASVIFVHLLLLALPLTSGHSWVERLRRLDSNGTMVGEVGYMRGAISRLDPEFNDIKQQYLLPPNGRNVSQGFLTSDFICRDTQRTLLQYSSMLPPLQAQPGEHIAIQYQENGHVTIPTPNRPMNSSISIYGTYFSTGDDRVTSIHKVWNANGTGGDKRGKLLGTWPFDDGRCYQINSGPISQARQKMYSKIPMDPQGADLWCQNDLRLPTDIGGGQGGWYTLYWVWEFPSFGPGGRMEIYTSCMDIRIMPGVQTGAVSYVDGQDINFAGIKGQMLGH